MSESDPPASKPLAAEEAPGSSARWRPQLPGFLMLPGDGLLLLDEKLTILWIDAIFTRAVCLHDRNPVGMPIREIWPELHETLHQEQAALLRGPVDASIPPPRKPLGEDARQPMVRLFRTDTGCGVVWLQSADSPGPTSPHLRLLISILNTVNEAMLVTLAEPIDLPGPIIIFANQRLSDYNGYAQEEILGRSPRMFQGAETDRQQLQRFREGLQRWDQGLTIEVLNYRKSGEPHWVEISTAPLPQPDGFYTHWVAVQRNISERKNLEHQLVRQACTDPLTGALNRRGLEEIVMQRLLPSCSGRLGMIYADLDNLKQFNDRFGHAAGDLLLMETIRRMRSVLRGDDVLARVGGDEFVMVLANPGGVQDVRRLAERLEQAMQPPWLYVGQQVTLSLSLGIAVAEDVADSAGVERLMRQADQAMYAVKASGRNRMQGTPSEAEEGG